MQYLTPAELSARWRGSVTVGTLANWRAKNRGPDYVKIGGRVLYPLAAVEDWELKQKKDHRVIECIKKIANYCAVNGCSVFVYSSGAVGLVDENKNHYFTVEDLADLLNQNEWAAGESRIDAIGQNGQVE